MHPFALILDGLPIAVVGDAVWLKSGDEFRQVPLQKPVPASLDDHWRIVGHEGRLFLAFPDRLVIWDPMVGAVAQEHSCELVAQGVCGGKWLGLAVVSGSIHVLALEGTQIRSRDTGKASSPGIHRLLELPTGLVAILPSGLMIDLLSGQDVVHANSTMARRDAALVWTDRLVVVSQGLHVHFRQRGQAWFQQVPIQQGPSDPAIPAFASGEELVCLDRQARSQVWHWRSMAGAYSQHPRDAASECTPLLAFRLKGKTGKEAWRIVYHSQSRGRDAFIGIEEPGGSSMRLYETSATARASAAATQDKLFLCVAEERSSVLLEIPVKSQ